MGSVSLVKPGPSYVFLDADGNHYGLFTRSKDQIDFYCEAKEAEDAPKEVVDALRSGTQILCYHSESSCTLPDGRVWEQYLFDGNKISGVNDYLCAYGPGMFDIRMGIALQSLCGFNVYCAFTSIVLKTGDELFGSHSDKVRNREQYGLLIRRWWANQKRAMAMAWRSQPESLLTLSPGSSFRLRPMALGSLNI